MFGYKRDSGTTTSSKNDIDTLLEKAHKLEREKKWNEAVSHYLTAINLSSEHAIYTTAQTWEKMGFCYHRSSRQAKCLEDFMKNGQSAKKAYRNAAKLFESEKSLRNQAKSDQCNAVAEYIGFWLSSTPQEKKEKLDNGRWYGKRSLQTYEDVGDELGYGIMSNYMLALLFESLYVASDWREMRGIVDEGKQCIRNAITTNSKQDNKNELLRSYSLGSLLAWYSANISEKEEERSELIQNSITYSEKALELTREVDDPYTSSIVYWAAAFSTLLFTKKVELSIEYAKTMLQHGTLVRDNYLIGVASYVLAFATNWLIVQEDDTDKKRQGHEVIIQYAKDAIQYLQLVSHYTFIAQSYWVFAESCSNVASDIETSLEGKRDRIESAIEIGRKGLEYARRSGSPDATGTTLHALSKALHLSSNFHTAQAEQRKLLEEALVYREEYTEIVQRSFPFNDWTHGVGISYKGLIEGEMAKNENNMEKKISLLELAISDMERSLSLCRKAIESRPVPTLIAAYGKFLNSYGGFLDQLYSLTDDEENLRKALEVYDDASKKYKEINLPSRAAESYWKKARDFDLLGENNKAAADFEKASTEYENAARKIPNFAHVFHEYASYMKAWSNIEKARYHHSIYQYDKEREFYQNTALLHEKTKRWNYLGIIYYAWAKLAEAEDLSRKEHTIEARDLFRETADLFSKGKTSIEAEIESIYDNDEKEVATELVIASDSRRIYCQGRIELEEAKLFDKKGEHSASSKKYASAAFMFQSIIDAGRKKDEQQEIIPIIHLCRAWHKMTLAEVEASPELYMEASHLFDEAKEYSVDQKTKQLIMGHASFCKALEAGTRYETSRQEQLHNELVRHLSRATNHYIKAGFEPALEYSKGTHRVFDAYIYLDEATKEMDPKKKARCYKLAERVLEASLEAFSKAKHPEKSDEVKRLLSSVKQERELALSLSEILETPTFSSSTMSFQAPTPSYEQPVGLERLENADIHARLFMSSDVVTSGEEFDIELELYNTGKMSASLMRVEKLIPDDFEVSRVPSYYRYDENILDLRGRRVGPLSSVEISLRVKPLSKGEYTLKPRIVFLDDTGERKTSEPEPTNLTVREMGILSWLRGSRPAS